MRLLYKFVLKNIKLKNQIRRLINQLYKNNEAFFDDYEKYSIYYESNNLLIKEIEDEN